MIPKPHSDLILRKNNDRVITFVSEGLSRFMGMNEEQILGTSVKLGEIPPTDNNGFFEELVETAYGPRWIYWHYTPLVTDGVEETLFIGRDIGEYREQFNELQNMKKRLEYILEGTNVGTWEWDIRTGKTILNEKWASIIGYELEELEPTSFKTWENHTHPDDLKASNEILDKIFKGELNYYEVECRMKHKDGHWVWVLDRGAVSRWDDDGNPLYMSGTHQDITKRKNAEASLHQRDAILNAMGFAANLLLKETDLTNLNRLLAEFGLASDASRAYIFEVYEQDKELYTSQRFEWCSPGTEPQIDNPALQHAPFKDMGFERWHTELSQGRQISGDVKEFPAGEREFLESQGIQSILILPIFLGDRWWGFIGFDQCEANKKWSTIETEALRASANIFGTALQRVESEKQLRLQSAALDAAANAIYITDRHGILEWINPAWTALTEYTEEEAIGQKTSILRSGYHDDVFYKDLWQRLISGEVWSGELVNKKRSGELYYELQTITPLMNEEGEISHFIGFKQDITDKKKAENKLKSSLKEKETLLAEIHHRVKNNLAVVSGMMQLQAQHSDNEELNRQLYNSVTRIKTIATVHELLYQSESFSDLSFGCNLKKLTDQLKSTLHTGKDIHIDLNADNVTLGVSQALPASLIANEVITNAFKHAFNGREEGALTVEVSERECEIEMRIADNGIGIKEDAPKKSSLGMQLINILTTQLGGSNKYRNTGAGSEFALKFRKN